MSSTKSHPWCKTISNNNNARKRKSTKDLTGIGKKAKFLEPIIYQRLIREVKIDTPEGTKTIQALFDTGANVFVLDHAWASSSSIFRIERPVPLTITGFAGQPETSAGKAFTPHLQLTIHQHITSISCELATREQGIQLIIPGERFLKEHPMTFDKGKIKIMEHNCYSPPGVIYDETVLFDPEAKLPLLY